MLLMLSACLVSLAAFLLLWACCAMSALSDEADNASHAGVM